ncbi:MAG: hypothetical protein ACFCUU_09505, partial [Cyclobacteriaceae bacterium]
MYHTLSYLFCNDNFIEADGGNHNIRILRNRGFNSGQQPWSIQPVLGGPVYWIRNVMYNCSNNETFKFWGMFPAGVICFAPPVHLWGNHEKVFRRFLIDHWHWNNDLYISMGFGDEPFMKETMEFCRLLGAHALERPIDFKFDLLPENTNQSIFEQSMANALKYFFKEIPLGILLPYDGAEGLRKYKAGLEDKFGFDPLNLKIPQQSIAIPLLPTALKNPDRLPWQYHWLKSDPEAVYSNNATDLFNLYNYLMAHSHQQAAAEIQKLLRSEFNVKRMPDWKTSKHANNYTSNIS